MFKPIKKCLEEKLSARILEGERNNPAEQSGGRRCDSVVRRRIQEMKWNSRKVKKKTKKTKTKATRTRSNRGVNYLFGNTRVHGHNGNTDSAISSWNDWCRICGSSDAAVCDASNWNGDRRRRWWGSGGLRGYRKHWLLLITVIGRIAGESGWSNKGNCSSSAAVESLIDDAGIEKHEP